MPRDTSDRLSRRRAVPLAFGSIAGSGILFLPSAVYVAAGHNSLLVWLAATLTCVPMLAMFDDIVRRDGSGAGIESLVRAGLGDTVASCVPVLFVALVVVGLPAGSLVAGRYVADALGLGRPAAAAGGAVVLGTALVVNLAGTRTGSRWQTAGTIGLVAISAALIALGLPGHTEDIAAITPTTSGLGVVAPGLLLAFWAFAGFENLTLLSARLADPGRDFLPVSVAALGLYGLFTVLLTATIALRVPAVDVDEVTGLLQLADTLRPRALVVGAVTTIALVAMTLNAIAWVWGVSDLVVDATARGALPPAPAGSAHPRRRALRLLGSLFGASTVVLVAAPGLVVDAVAAASSVFVVLYLLCIVSWVRVRGLTARTVPNLALLVVLAGGLVDAGPRSAYAVAALALAAAVQTARRRLAPPAGDRAASG